MTRCFADTFYFLALLNPRDDAHEQAAKLTIGLDGFATTDFVLTELADAMSQPGDRQWCVRFLKYLRSNPNAKIARASGDVFDAGLDLFASRRDKEWTLTDCISFAVMKKLGLTDALTGDHHFEQAGFTALLKSGPRNA